MTTDIATLKAADWDKLEQQVRERIAILRAIVTDLDASPISDKLANDLILPAVALLADFCTRVTIDDEAAETLPPSAFPLPPSSLP